MDITKVIAQLKEEPGFGENVGMILAHNGTVRGCSRQDGSAVRYLEVTPDCEKIEAIRGDIARMPGIFRVVVEAKGGRLVPGDDLLFLIVAGDIRENVKAALSLLLERIKAEAVTKREILHDKEL